MQRGLCGVCVSSVVIEDTRVDKLVLYSLSVL